MKNKATFYAVHDLEIYMTVWANGEECTVKDIARFLNLPVTPVRRVCERLRKEGHLHRRVETFWNGMHYAKRFHYRLKD